MGPLGKPPSFIIRFRIPYNFYIIQTIRLNATPAITKIKLIVDISSN